MRTRGIGGALVSMLMIGAAACGAVRSTAGSDAGDGGAQGDADGLTACPDPSADPDGGIRVDLSDAAYANYPPDDASLASGLSIEPPPGVDASAIYGALFPDFSPFPGPMLIRAMSPLYRVTSNASVPLAVTIPLAPGYAECSAAVYVYTGKSWARTGPPSTRVVSGYVAGNASAEWRVVAGTCKATECNATCTDTASDDANCGACGNACPSGTFCANGACSGQLLCDVATSTGGAAAAAIALDATNVFFGLFNLTTSTPQYAVASCPRAGGALSIVVPNLPAHVDELRVAGGALFGSAGGGTQYGIEWGMLPSPAPSIVAGGPIPGFAGPFATDGTSVFFAVNGSSVVKLAATASSPSAEVTLATTRGASAVDTDGTHLAWTESGPSGAVAKVLDLTAQGAAPVPLAGPAGAVSLAEPRLDGDAVYVLATMQGASGPSIARLPRDGSAAQIVGALKSSGDFAVSGGAVAWTDSYGQGSVYAMVPGKPAVEISGGRGIGGSIAVAGDSVYVVGSKVWRIPLPK